MVKVVRAKLHGIRVNQADPHSRGSITLDLEALRRRAHLSGGR